MNRIQDTPQRRPPKPLRKGILDNYGGQQPQPSRIPAQGKGNGTEGGRGRSCPHTIDEGSPCPVRSRFLAELLAKRGWA